MLLLFLIITIIIIFNKEIKTIKYANSKYGVNSFIVSKEKKDNGSIKYNMVNKSNGVKFICTSSIEDFELDNTKFFNYRSTSCNYYEMLTNYLQEKIDIIQNKYNVIFKTNYKHLIDQVIINDSVENRVEDVTKAVNELMKIYNLKRDVNEKIYIVSNDKDSNYCYPYTTNGKKTKLHNYLNDFYKQNNINNKMVEEVKNYINKKYSVESTLTNTSVANLIVTTPKKYKDVILTFTDKNKEFKIEVTIDKEKYNKDKNNNSLVSIDNYISQETEIKYSP